MKFRPEKDNIQDFFQTFEARYSKKSKQLEKLLSVLSRTTETNDFKASYLERLGLDEEPKYAALKAATIDRFSSRETYVKYIEDYLDVIQDKKETTKRYVDRFLSAKRNFGKAQQYFPNVSMNSSGVRLNTMIKNALQQFSDNSAHMDKFLESVDLHRFERAVLATHRILDQEQKKETPHHDEFMFMLETFIKQARQETERRLAKKAQKEKQKRRKDSKKKKKSIDYDTSSDDSDSSQNSTDSDDSDSDDDSSDWSRDTNDSSDDEKRTRKPKRKSKKNKKDREHQKTPTMSDVSKIKSEISEIRNMVHQFGKIALNESGKINQIQNVNHVHDASTPEQHNESEHDDVLWNNTNCGPHRPQKRPVYNSQTRNYPPRLPPADLRCWNCDAIGEHWSRTCPQPCRHCGDPKPHNTNFCRSQTRAPLPPQQQSPCSFCQRAHRSETCPLNPINTNQEKDMKPKENDGVSVKEEEANLISSYLFTIGLSFLMAPCK